MRRGLRWALALGWLGAAAAGAEAAVVEKVMADRDLVILKVSKREHAALERGQTLSVKVRGTRDTAEIEVTGLEPGRAKAQVLFGMGLLKTGDSVRLQPSASKGEKPGKSAGVAFGYPFVYSGRLRSRYEAPASTLATVERAGAFLYLRQERLLSSGETFRSRGRYTAFGLTAVGAFVNGLRLGAGYDSEELEDKVKLKAQQNGADQHVRRGWSLAAYTAHAAYVLKERYSVGIKYSATRARLYAQTGLGRETFANIEASAGYITPRMEAHLSFTPELEVSEADAQLRRPYQWTLFFKRKVGEGVGLANVRVAAEEAMGLRGGYEQAVGFGTTVGALLGYEHQSFKDEEEATPDTIARGTGSLFARYSSDSHTHYAFVFEGEAGDGAGIKTESTSYQASLTRLF